MTPVLRSVSAALALALVASVPPALAQEPEQQQPPPSRLVQAAQQSQAAEAPPGHLAAVDGDVVLERGNQSEEAVDGMPLIVGDRLRADSGHVEVMWAEGSLLKVGRYTDLDVISNTVIRVTRGRVTITVPNLPGQVVNRQLSIDAPGASARFFSPGVYQVLVTGDEEPEVQLGVTHGSAQLTSDRGQVTLADAESSEVKGGGLPSQPEHFLASVADSTYDPTPDLAVFQGGANTGQGYASTQYLPQDLYGYENVLENNGTWSQDANYGYVWFPRVSAGWRPYYHGRWSYLPRYGWTWVGQDRFAWPTHYYGRWGVTNGGAWYWIPSRQWGPAWVAWSISPEYVGWCPLGWNGRPVYSFATVTTTATNYRGSETYRGWSVVGSRNFGNHDVPKYVVERSVIARDRPAFVTQYNSPRAPNGVVGRNVRSYSSRGNGNDSGGSGSGAVRRGNDDVSGRNTGRRARPDGMSRDDNRDPGGNDGRSTVAPVLPRDDNGTVRPPSGMSGPPGVYAPARTAPRRTNDGDGNGNNGGNANGGNANGSNGNASGNRNGRGAQSQPQTQSQPQSQPQTQSQPPAQSTGGGGMRRSSPGNQSGSGSTSKESKGSNDGSSGKSTDANSTSSSGSSGKSSDNNGSSGAVRRRP